MTSIASKYLEISKEVRDAKAQNRPIVALESTIITHGLPFPTNMQTAFEIEKEIRNFDVVPATVALINGRLKVGLTKDELEFVAKSHESAVKLSRRDLTHAFAFSSPGLVGGTTVSTTMMAAHSAGIPIFVTGGIGGVHRDYNDSMDVSADLQELARTPVAVVSSGVKSILDIGKTLEYLETMGVCVYTLDSQGTKEFPSFFTSKSGVEAPYNLLNESQAASIIRTHLDLGLNSGLLIGVPIPAEHSADHSLIETAIQEALKEANQLKIRGKQVTPFLLAKINQITRGQSLRSNIELIKNNARIGAKIALELSKRRHQKPSPGGSSGHVTVIGGVNLDNTYKLVDEKTVGLKGVTQPTLFNQSLGGVGRNMAEALLRFKIQDSRVQFITAVADDLAGKVICHESNSMGLDSSKWLIVENKDSSREAVATGSYCAIFEKSGELMLGLGDMRSHDHISVEHLTAHLDCIKDSRVCVIDADLSVESIDFLCKVCQAENIPVWFNPTDLRKCDKIIKASALDKITFASPNMKELLRLFKSLLIVSHDHAEVETKRVFAKIRDQDEDKIELSDEDLKIILKTLLNQIPFIVLSRGADDLLLASAIDLPVDDSLASPLPASKQSLVSFKQNFKWCPTLISYPVVQLDPSEQLVNVSGAGDSTCSGIIAGLLKGYSLTESIYNGLLAGKYALLTHKNVSSRLDAITPGQLRSVIQSKQSQIKKTYL